MKQLLCLILKTDGESVKDFYVLNDFFIKDVIQDKNQLILLCDDLKNQNIYWKSSYTAKIIKLDKSLNEIWKYESGNNFALEAVSSRNTEKGSLHTINVITGSHASYNIVELELSDKGKFKSVKGIGTNESEKLSLETLQEIFLQNP